MTASNYFIGHLGGYCDNSDCSARTLDLHVKHRERQPLPALRCPLCGGPLSHTTRQTMSEYRVQERQRARCSVNVQRYIRDRTPPGQLAIVPATVYGDDTLPAARYQLPTGARTNDNAS